MNRVHLRRRPGRKIWEIYFTLNGRRVFKSLKVTDKRIAEDLRADYEFKLRRRELHLPRPIPIETAKEEYWAYQLQPGLARETLQRLLLRGCQR